MTKRGHLIGEADEAAVPAYARDLGGSGRSRVPPD